MKLLWRYLFFLFPGLAVIVGVGIFVINSGLEAIKTDVVTNLGRSVDVAVATIDPKSFIRLQARPTDVESADYTRLREQMIKLEAVFKKDGIRGLYAMKVDGQEIRFFVDSAADSDEWHSLPGVAYMTPPPAIAEVAASGEERFTGPYTDEYGSYYSFFGRIKDSTGASIAVMGADIDAERYTTLIRNEQSLPIGLTIAFACAYALILYALMRRQEILSVIMQQRKALEEKNTELLREKKISDEDRRRLEVLIEQMPVGIFIAEPKYGKPLISNKKAIELLGRNIDPAKGALSYIETYMIEDENGNAYPKKILPATFTLNTRKAADRSDLFAKHPDGSRKPLRMVSAPIVGANGKLTAIAVVWVDRSDAYELEKRKSEFIAVASHQLRTPLTTIKWLVEMFGDKTSGPLTAPQQKKLGQITTVIQHLNALINQLLNVSRLESNSVGVEPKMTDMNALIKNVIDELSPQFEHLGLSFSYKRTPLPLLNIDADLIREVFMNLLSNAMKYTLKGGKVRLTAEVRKRDVIFTINDNGIGIPKTQQAQLFNKFFRADNALAVATEGTGLGLYIAKRAVDLSGGTLGFTSIENDGSNFWFTLPLSGSAQKIGTKGLLRGKHFPD